MRALCWHAQKDVRVETVPEPRILNPRDAVIKVTSTAICGSDLHLFNNVFPGMMKGDILGHEFMGEVMEVGPSVKNIKPGDRVVVPFDISCGGCFFCKKQLFSCCDNANPAQVESEKMFGYPAGAAFGYSHLTGGYAGGQSEYVRVPFADVGPLKVPQGIDDDKVLFLSDIMPTAWMGAENCEVEAGDTVAVWGAGPVGLLAIQALKAMGAERIIVIDRVVERLALARQSGAQTLNTDDADVYETLYDMTGGRGPDACLDAVGMEAHGTGVIAALDRLKQAVGVEQDRPAVLRQMVRCARKGGRISILGVYAGMIDTWPMGVAFAKGIQFKMGQCHVQRYQDRLLDMVLEGKLRPEIIISHRLSLEDGPDAYKNFNEKKDGCVKVVMKPGMSRTRVVAA